MNSTSGRGCQPGWCMKASSSTYGTPRRVASARAIVDLPAPLDPTTETRRTGAKLRALRSGCGHQGREVHAHVGERGLAHGPAAFDQLATHLVGLRVVHRKYRVDEPVAEIENRERKAITVAAPDGPVLARGVAAVLHVHVVLV